MDLEKTKFNQVKYQYLIVFGANIISLCHGFAVGWLSPSLTILKSQDTPLQSGPLTLEQTMLLGGLYPLGGFLGNCVFAVLANNLGRITSMSFLAIPSIIYWLIVLLSSSFEQLAIGLRWPDYTKEELFFLLAIHLLVARVQFLIFGFIAGMSGGGSFVCIPLFVAEIAQKEIRGFLGLMGPLIVSIGILMSYICGAYIEYRYVPYCIIGFPILFLIVMYFTPETPHTLIRQKKIQKAENSLIFYNNGNSAVSNGYNVKQELYQLQLLVERREEEKKKNSLVLIFQKESLKKLLTGIALVVISIFSGISAVVMYASQLFIDSGANFDPNLSSIIIGILQVFGIYASSMLVDRIGRKILFGVSSLGAALSLIIFGTFSYLSKHGFDLSVVDWIPVVSASFYVFINCVGIKPFPFLYVAESMPDNVRHIGQSICMMTLTLLSSLIVFTLPILVKLFDLYAVLWAYGAVCILGIFFSIFVMNETKGKNINKVDLST